eukprot:311957-Chlamydomonas_euryale.AAC.6
MSCNPDVCFRRLNWGAASVGLQTGGIGSGLTPRPEGVCKSVSYWIDRWMDEWMDGCAARIWRVRARAWQKC